MRKIFLPLILVIFVLFLIYSLPFTLNPIRADEVEDLQEQINKLSKSKDLSVAATKPLEGQLESLKQQLTQIQNSLKALSAKIIQKEKDVKIREEKLVYQQVLMNERVRNYYIRSYLSSPLIVLLSSQNSGGLFRELSYRQAATREDQRIISDVTSEMLDLLKQKEKLEKDKTSLAVFQEQVDKNADFIDGEVQKAKKYQAELTNQIAQLTAKQQAILAAKSGNFTTSVGDVPLFGR